MKRPMLYALLMLVLAAPLRVADAQIVPTTNASALDGSLVQFPAATRGRALVLVIAFSRAAIASADSWMRRLTEAYERDPRVAYYQLADFDGVPSFVLWFIKHGMRRSMPPEAQAHVVPLRTGEADWTHLVHPGALSDAYVVVADTLGRVVWQGHGVATDSAYGALHHEIDLVLAKTAELN